MTRGETPVPGLRREHPEAVRAAAALGQPLRNWRSVSTGQGRTIVGRTRSGRAVAVKWSTDPQWAAWLPQAFRCAALLRSRGYPCPDTVAHGPVLEGYCWILERLPGRPMRPTDGPGVLDKVMDLVDLQADAPHGLLTGRADAGGWVAGVVDGDTAGWWRHAAALGHQTAALCDAVRAWAADHPPTMTRRDVVHLDLNLTNVLVHRERVCGIVDLDHLGIGDRCVDLACLAFSHAQHEVERRSTVIRRAITRLHERAVSISGEGGWRQGVAYEAAAWLGWTSADGFRICPELARAVVPIVMAG